jgi:ribosomal protein L30/L7E
MRRIRLNKVGTHTEVHFNQTYRLVKAGDTVRDTVKTLRNMGLHDEEIGKVLICICEPEPHTRAVTIGLHK